MTPKVSLKKRNINKLIKALRSGSYNQITGKMRNNDGFDTLGVACEVYKLSIGKGKWGKIKSSLDGEMIFTIKGKENIDTVLPEDVQQWYGFEYDCPSIIYKGKDTLLIDLNDFHKLSFEKIADLLEKNLCQLVKN